MTEFEQADNPIIPVRIIPVGDLSEKERAELISRANWQVDGKGDWEELTDPRYGRILHVAVLGEDNLVQFDKLNIQWTSGVYVVIVRVNPERKVEFLLPRERRILLRDKEGKQGNVFINNIPQGVIKEWENEKGEAAARREIREETGYELKSLALIGRIALATANSETIQPFFLAIVPYGQRPYEQQLEDSESIESEKWFTWQQIHRMPIIDGNTYIGLFLAQKCIRPELL